MDKNTKDQLVEKAVGESVRKDMEMVSRTFDSVVKKYSFLFDGDSIEAQKMLINACFPLNKAVLEIPKNGSDDEEKVYFDMNVLLKSIPQSMKDELYKRILEQFVSKIEIDDLQKNQQEGEQ